MGELYVSSHAEADYQEALNWYSNKDSILAERFDQEFNETLLSIGESPRWQAKYDRRHWFVRLKHFPYLVIYRQFGKEDWVVVVVTHTSRRPNWWRGRNS